jgi:hypothetical protein
LLVVVQIDRGQLLRELEPRLRARIRVIARVARRGRAVEAFDFEFAKLAQAVYQASANPHVVGD